MKQLALGDINISRVVDFVPTPKRQRRPAARFSNAMPIPVA